MTSSNWFFRPRDGGQMARLYAGRRRQMVAERIATRDVRSLVVCLLVWTVAAVAAGLATACRRA